jgi:hypothetical protein
MAAERAGKEEEAAQYMKLAREAMLAQARPAEESQVRAFTSNARAVLTGTAPYPGTALFRACYLRLPAEGGRHRQAVKNLRYPSGANLRVDQ